MRSTLLVGFACVVGLVIWTSRPSAQQQGTVFHGIGDLAGGGVNSIVQEATQVGSTIYAVGASTRTATGAIPNLDTAVVWDSASGALTIIPDLVTFTPPLPTSNNSAIFAVTPDAQFIGGRLRNSTSTPTTSNGMRSLRTLGSLRTIAPAFTALDISDDGNIVYGQQSGGTASVNNSRAVRADVSGATTTTVDVPRLTPAAITPGGPCSASAPTCLDNLPAYRGMSADGSILVGTAFTGAFTGTQNQFQTTNGLAFRWVFNQAAVSEIPRPAGGTWSNAVAVSPDGNLTLASGNSAEYGLGEVWLHDATTNTIAELGSPNTAFTPRLWGGMTRDGSVVGVTFTSGAALQGATLQARPLQYAYLHNSHGWFHLADVLTAQGVGLWANGWEPTNMILTGMRTVDTDGNGTFDVDLVFGQGRRRNADGSSGAAEGFVASFPVGVLAGYQLPVAAPVANRSLVGAWTIGPPPSNPSLQSVIVFLADGTFYTTTSWSAWTTLGLPSGARFERGVYTLSANNAITLTTTEDRDGTGPPQSGTTPATYVYNGLMSSLNGRQSLAVSFTSGDTFTVEDASCSPLCSVFQGTRITGGAGTIAGAWTITNPPWVPNGRFVIVFLNASDGLRYFEIGDGVPESQNGSGSGTYTFTAPSSLVLTEDPGGTPRTEDVTLTRDELGVVAIDENSQPFTLTRVVNPSTVVPVITSGLSATGTTGTPFSYTITATYGLTFDAVGLPAPLAVDAATGVISGTPVTTGDFPITIAATNTFGTTTTATLSLAIRSEQAPLTVTAPTSATYSTSFTAGTSGGSGTGAVTFATANACSNVGPLVTMTSGSGTCTITATKAGDGTYQGTTSAAFSVTAVKANQAALVLDAPSVAADASSYVVGVSGGSGTGVVTVTSSGDCTNVGPLVTMTSGTGSCVVTATKDGDANFNGAAHPGVRIWATPANEAFIGIGDLTGGNLASIVMDATKVNGSIYAVGAGSKGANTAGANTDSPSLWTWNGSTGALTPLPEQVVFANPPTNSHWAYDITPNAGFIGSRVRNDVSNQNTSNAVLVTRSGSTLTNFILPGPAPVGFATAAVSDNGSVAYAHAGSSISTNNRIVRYNLPNGAKSDVPFLSGFSQLIPTIGGASSDGSVLVGTGVSALWTGSNGRAFRYDHGAGTTTAIPLLTGGTWSFPIAISSNGNLTVVAGDSDAVPNGELYLHDQTAGTTTALGSPNTAWGPRQFGGMTDDGSVVAVTYAAGAWGAAAQVAIPTGNRYAYLRNTHGWFHLASALLDRGIDIAARGWSPVNMLVTGITTAEGVDLVFGQALRTVTLPVVGTVSFQEGFVAEFPAGYLASFNPPLTPPQGTAIVGGWFADVLRTSGTTTELDTDVAVYMADGTYVHVQGTPQPVTNTAAAVGFERGLYSWRSDTQALSVTPRYDTNGGAGYGGFVGSPGLAFSPSTGVLSGSAILANAFTRVAAGVPVGAWIKGNPAVADDLEMFIFRDDGTYFHARDGLASAAQGSVDGVEAGTYSWDAQNLTLTRTATTVDRNGAWGLSTVSGPASVSVSADGLQITFTSGAPGVYTRVVDPATIPVITSPLTATGTLTQAFSYTITATSGVSFDAPGLPDGLSLDTATGAITGVPTAPGTTTVAISATNASGVRTTAPLAITIVRATQSPLTVLAPASAAYGSTFGVNTSGGSGTGAVTFGVSGGCSITATTVTMTSGTVDCVVSATKDGDATYEPAQASAATVDAQQVPATVTPHDATKVYGSADPALSGSLSGFLASDNVSATYSRTAGETVAGGPYTISATLAPNGVLGNYQITYGTANFTITPAATTTVLSASPNPSSPGQTVDFVATVTSQHAGLVSGTVTFTKGQQTLGTAPVQPNGTATLPLSTLGEGSTVVSATYGGDLNNVTSTSPPVTQRVVAPVAPTTTTLTSSLNPSITGQAVTLTAAVTSSTPGAITGTVDFFLGQTVLFNATLLNGQATYTTTTLPLGALGVTAKYSGNAQYVASTSTVLTQVVSKATTSTALVSSPNPSVGGQPVTLTATITPSTLVTPIGGTVRFRRGSTVLGSTTVSGGQAVFTTAALPAGASNLTAVYDGDATYAASTSAAISHTVSMGTTTTTLTATPNPSTAGSLVTFTATVVSSVAGAIPTGTVEFVEGGTLLGTGTLDALGVATFGTSTLALKNGKPATHNIKARYLGDAYNGTSTSATYAQVITP